MNRIAELKRKQKKRKLIVELIWMEREYIRLILA